MTPVGIRSSIESSWERSSPPRTRDFAAPSRSAARPQVGMSYNLGTEGLQEVQDGDAA